MSCDQVVFVDESAEHITASETSHVLEGPGTGFDRGSVGTRPRDRCGWWVGVMRDVGVENPGQTLGTDDEEMVEAFAAPGPHPTLRECRVRVWGASSGFGLCDRRLHGTRGVPRPGLTTAGPVHGVGGEPREVQRCASPSGCSRVEDQTKAIT
jgi:hypothetical protein